MGIFPEKDDLKPAYGVFRYLKIFFKGVVFLLALLLIIILVENIRGIVAFSNWKKSHPGYLVELKEIIPPQVPDDQNFALVGIFKEILPEYTNCTQIPNPSPQFAKFLSLNKTINNCANEIHRRKPNIDSLHYFENLHEWAETLRLQSTNYPHISTNIPDAEYILEILKEADPVLNELREATKTRPFCRFPIQYEKLANFREYTPHFYYLKSLLNLLKLRAICLLESGQIEKAFEDAKFAFKLANCLTNEPLGVSLIIRNSLNMVAAKIIIEGFVRNSWKVEHLKEFMRMLSEINLLSQIPVCLRAEANASTQFFLTFYKWKYNETFGEYEEIKRPDLVNEFYFTMAKIVTPFGWIYQNAKNIADLAYRTSYECIDLSNNRIYPTKIINLESELRTKGFPIYSFLSLLVYNGTSLTTGTAFSQSCINCLETACAIEQFYIETGKLPETSSALVPRYINKLPTDIIDGKPLRYKLLSSNEYLIYSIGWNEKDENGLIEGNSPRTNEDWGIKIVRIKK